VQKLALKGQEIDSSAFCAVFLGSVGILSIPVLIFEDVVIPTSWWVWLITVFNGFLYAVCMMLFYHALKGTEVSQVEAIATTRTLWFVVLGIIFFTETLNLSLFIGVGLIALGLFVIYWNKNHSFRLGKYQIYTFIYAFIISCNYALDKYLLDYFSVTFYQVVIYILPALFTLIIKPQTLKHIKPLFQPHKGRYLIGVSTILQATSTLALYAAYKSGGALSVVGPIAQTSTVVTITVGILFLKEHWNLKRKVTGIVLCLAGVFILRIFV